MLRHLSFRLELGSSYAFTGPNGSGKSTLLQLVAGIIPVTEGTVSYHYQGKPIDPEHFFRHLVIAAPYLELIEELTLIELFRFHIQFKALKPGLTVDECIAQLYLEKSRNKPIRHFSSGMKQRLKLGLAFYSQTPILMLDEPTANLDAQGIAWYQANVQRESQDRLLIICSNQPYEYEFCPNVISVGGN